MARNDLTAEYVRSILDYNPETGAFTWKHRSDVRKEWNTRYAGKNASNFDKSNNRFFVCINHIHYYAHRLAWIYMTGEWPKELIDHEDLNPQNNKWDNLREATPSQNQQNQGKPITNTSGYKGVAFHKQRNKWRASISINNKTKHLGLFNCPTAAYFAYCRAAKEHYGEFSRVA